MKEKLKDKYSIWVSRFYWLSTILLSLYAICMGAYKGFATHSSSGFISWFLLGLMSAIAVAAICIAFNFGMMAWGKMTDRIMMFIRRFPQLRLWMTFPGLLLLFLAAYLVIRYWETELTLRIFLAAYLALLLPAAIISLLRDDLDREQTKLSKEISRSLQIKDPQAAIEYAFTNFEDHLLRRFPRGTKLYGNKLIEAAYHGTTSKLIYYFEEKDYTEALYHLMSGAYSIFRNPHDHLLIADNEQETQAIISLAELLTDYIDKSKERDKLMKKSMKE